MQDADLKNFRDNAGRGTPDPGSLPEVRDVTTAQDYQLVPFLTLQSDTCLRDSYIAMIHALHADPALGPTSEFGHWTEDLGPLNFDEFFEEVRGLGKKDPGGLRDYKLSVFPLVHTPTSIIAGQSFLYKPVGNTATDDLASDHSITISGHLTDFVHPEARGKGLGKVLFARGIEKAADLGMDTLVIKVGVENVPSLRRLNRLGNAGLASHIDTVPKGCSEEAIFHVAPNARFEQVMGQFLKPASGLRTEVVPA